MRPRFFLEVFGLTLLLAALYVVIYFVAYFVELLA